MELLNGIFGILTVVGCWRPPYSAPRYKRFLYTVYTVILFTILYLVTFLQFIDVLLVPEHQDEWADNIYITLTMMVSCLKMYGLLASHKNIDALIDILEKEPFQPQNEKEMEIRKTFDKKVHSQVYLYMGITVVTVSIVSSSGFSKTDEITLPHPMWLPFNNIPLHLFLVIYFLQVIGLFTASIMHNACDAVIWGLLNHTCSQLEILGSRLEFLKPDDDQSAKGFVRYHNHVYRFAKMVNDEFQTIITVQFGVSMLVICFTLYVMVMAKELDARLIKVTLYGTAILIQIFFFCFYGNEVKLKSAEVSDAVFRSDWTQLNQENKKILLMIMRRATMCIEVNSAHVVNVNLESFVNLLKTSYSAYNVLKND